MKYRKYRLILLLTVLASATYGQDLFQYRQGRLWGFCDSAKRIFIAPQCQSADVFSSYHISTVQLNDKYGFINKDGQKITQIISE